ncbi:MAG: ethanolamine permease [Chlamydiales bacterium]|jgi:ethanolamine permease
MGDDSQGSVSYEDVEEGYFERRGLRRYAGAWSLWALGVGAVISGDFFGWNFGLAAGGFGGLLIATGIVTLMYLGLCDSIAEMTSALPHTGGAYSFGRSAMGPWGGFIAGLAENMEYVLTPAVIVVGIGGYLGAVFGTPDSFEPGWWLIAYTLFVGLNIWGVEASFRFTVFITFLALAILAVFYVGAIAHFDLDMALDVVPTEGHSRWLPFGWPGVLAATPFAVWFFLAIEQLPLAAEEAHDPQRDLPRGILLGLLTLIVCAILTLFLNSGIAPGAAAVGASDEPLFLGFQTIFGVGLGSKLLALVAVAGLIASFHTIVYAYGRNIYSLSRSGYFPRWLSVTHSTRETPHVALITGAVVGFAVALVVHFQQAGLVGAALLNMAVFGAVIAYVMQMLAFIKLRRNLPDVERPYRSRGGIPGALIAGLIAATILVYLLLDVSYRPAIVGCLIWFLAGLGYFAVRGRHRLVRSPEEEFAIQNRSAR